MADSKVDLWFTDEVHFQQHGSRCRMWIAPEHADPVIMHEPTRRSVGYFGAVRLRDGKFVYRRETEKFNAKTFWDFLKQMRKTSSHSGKNESFFYSYGAKAFVKLFHIHFLFPLIRAA